MVKTLLIIAAVVWIVASLAAGTTVGTIVAGNLFVLGLLVIIAISVQPKREPAADTADYEPDADLFEDFDDPYAEPESAPASRFVPPIRVKPRRKANA